MNLDAHESNNAISLVISALSRSSFTVFRPITESGWGAVSSSQLLEHIYIAANKLEGEFRPFSLRQADVVAVWVSGNKYQDVVNILAVILLGYVPELFSRVWSNVQVIWDLTRSSGAKILVFDPIYSEAVSASPLPKIAFWNPSNAVDAPHADYTPRAIPKVHSEDTVIIVHSSGTTAGTPKIIPGTHGWLEFYCKVKYPACLNYPPADQHHVVNTIGSLAHVGAFKSFVAAIYLQICTVQGSSMDLATSELLSMIQATRLNHLVAYAPSLSRHLRHAMDHPETLKVLQSLRLLIHTGVSINKQDEAWGFDNDIPLTSMYGCTETSPLMLTVVGSKTEDHYLRFIPEVSAGMIPYIISGGFDDQESSSSQLFEVVVYPGKIDSPHHSLLSSDSLFHTGDLFEEKAPGLYLYRGRGGDWIKTLGGFCDATAFEDATRESCQDIVEDVVVCGSNRPFPCMFVEVNSKAYHHHVSKDVKTDESSDADAALKAVIIQRLRKYQQRLFTYERIEDPSRIRFLRPGEGQYKVKLEPSSSSRIGPPDIISE